MMSSANNKTDWQQLIFKEMKSYFEIREIFGKSKTASEVIGQGQDTNFTIISSDIDMGPKLQCLL